MNLVDDFNLNYSSDCTPGRGLLRYPSLRYFARKMPALKLMPSVGMFFADALPVDLICSLFNLTEGFRATNGIESVKFVIVKSG